MSKKRERENDEALGETVETAEKPAAKGKRAANPPPAQPADLPAAADTVDATPGPITSSAASGETAVPSETATTGEPTKAETFGVVAPAVMHFEEVLWTQLNPSPLNPRKKRDPGSPERFGRSIAEKGLLQPLLCRPTSDTDPKNPRQFEVAIGSQRHAGIRWAVENLVLPRTYKVAIRWRPMTDDELLIIAGVENFDRDDMDHLDQAELFATVRERIVTVPGQSREDAVGALFHITGRTVFRRLDLLKLSDEAKAELRDGRITLNDAYVLADQTPEAQDALIEEARAAVEPPKAEDPAGAAEQAAQDPPQPEGAEEPSPTIAEGAAHVESVIQRQNPDRPTRPRLTIRKPADKRTAPIESKPPVDQKTLIDILVGTLRDIAAQGDERSRKIARTCLTLQGFPVPAEPEMAE